MAGNQNSCGATDAFTLRSLPADLLEGVLQRLRAKAKKEAECVDRGFAAIARRRAWRHRNSLVVNNAQLILDQVRFGPFGFKTARVAAAARFLSNRSAIHHVEISNYHAEPLNQLKQKQARGMLTDLLSSARVSLHSLLLKDSAKRLLGSVEQLVALIHRHSATLQQAAIGLRDDQMETAVYAALHDCPNLRELKAIQIGQEAWSGALEALVRGLQLHSLTLCFCDNFGGDLTVALPNAPTLRELRLRGGSKTHVPLSDCVNWRALANVRLLEMDNHSLPLGTDDAKTKKALSNALPNIETLIVRSCLGLNQFYWGVAKALVNAFLNRAGNDSLSVEVTVQTQKYHWPPRRYPLAEWRDTFPELLVERFDRAKAVGGAGDAACGGCDAAAAVATRPTLPKEFAHAGTNGAFVLSRPNESRCITIAVWERVPKRKR